MIDFRYHIVSLIAVFLALAVGIVLGAGPLRDTIGETLTGQVQDLREDRERLRSELDAAVTDTNERTAYLEASAGTLLADTLTDQRVAIVTLPGTEGDDVESVRDRLAQAGAQVVGEVAVTAAWADPDGESFRQSFAGQVLGYLDPAPASDAGPATILGQALAQALTVSGPDGAARADSGTVLDLLTSADDPLVTLTTEPTAPADATVLVGPPPAQPEEGATPAAQEAVSAVLASHVDLAEALATTSASVTVGAAVYDGDLVTAVRADDAGGSVTTVDSGTEITGVLSTPLAVAVSLSGAHGAYGFQRDADAPVPPRVQLRPATEPTAPAGEEPTAGADATADANAAAASETPAGLS